MSTSLSRQLQKLQTPQTGQSSVNRRVYSILFDTHTAEELTIDKAFQLGVQGLKELQILNPSFKEFEVSLFSEESKGIQRAVQTKDYNEKLDQTIKKFLIMVSPNLLLKPALQSLEWLVHRFQIGEYNTVDLMMCAFPYHNTPTFCLVLRAIPEIKKENSPWAWLQPVVHSGIPLDIHTVHKNFANQLHLLRMLVQHTISSYKEFALSEVGRLQILFSFTTSVLLGVLVLKKQDLNQNQLACMVPFIHTGLSSKSTIFLSSSLAVVTHLAAAHPLSDSLAQEIITQLVLVKLDSLGFEAMSVLVLLFTAQSRLLGRFLKFSSFIVTKLATNPKFPEMLAQIQDKNQTLNLTPFLIPLFETSLNECKDEKQFSSKGVDKMIIKIFERLFMPTDQAAVVIRFFLSHIPDTMNNSEIAWFSNLFKMLESRYPSVLDAQTRELFSKDSVLKESYHVILTHHGLQSEDGVMTLQGLCHQLVHPEEAVRASAVRTAAKLIKDFSDDDKAVLQSCLKDRLKDESMVVVCAVLTMKQFTKLIADKDKLLDVLLELLEHAQYNNWSLKAIANLLAHVGNSFVETLKEEKELNAALHVLPHLLANPTFFSVFSETKICSRSAILKEIVKKVSSTTSDKAPENVVLLSAAHEALKKCKADALRIVEKRLEKENLSSMDLYLLCAVLQGVASNLPTALLRMECCRLAMAIKSRAKISFPKHPLYPPISKAKLLAFQYTDITVNKSLPIEAFTEIMLAIVRKPMKPMYEEIVKNIEDSLNILNPKGDDVSEAFESSQSFKWCSLLIGNKRETEEEMYLQLAITVMSILLELCPKFEHVDDEQPHMAALRTFILLNFNTLEGQLHFLSQMWSQPELPLENKLRAVIFSASILKLHPMAQTSILQLHPDNCFVPALFSILSHPESAMREVAVKLLAEIAKLKPRQPTKSYHPLILYLLQMSDEIILNKDQFAVALFSILTEEKSVKEVYLKSEKMTINLTRKCLFAHCTSEQTPKAIAAELLRNLAYVKSQDCLMCLIPLADRLLKETSEFGEHDFEVLKLFIARIDENTAKEFLGSKSGWTCYENILNSKLSFADVAVGNYAVNSVSKEMFSCLDAKLKSQVVHALLKADNELSNMKGTVATLLRKLNLDGELVASELGKMIGISNKKTAQRRATRSGAVSTSAAAAKVTSTLEWSEGVVLLEALPEKRKMTDAHLVVPTLFNILKICLESEDDQEYVKQLALSSLNTLLVLSQEKGASCQVDIELIVNSLKATSNPRTQRETLVLLCHVAHLVPDNLMHHLVSVFTFMGNLVLRHDDEYSLQIISQVIQDVVPVIIKSKGNMAGLTNILRVFSDALPDIPSHRRLLVFEQLMSTVGWDHLWLLLTLVFECEAYGKQSSKRVECILEVTKTCTLPVLLKMLHRQFLFLNLLTEIEYGNEKQVTNSVEIKMKMKTLPAMDLMDPCLRPASEVRKLQIMTLDFLSNLLNIKPSDNQGLQATEKLSPELEKLYQGLMDCLMSYLLVLSQKEARHKSQSKFWSCLLLQGYAVLNKLNMLLPLAQFVSVVQGVLTNPDALGSVKSKTLELLGAKLQLLNKATDIDTMELSPLVSVCQQLALQSDSTITGKALFCMRLLVSLLGTEGLHAHETELKNLLNDLFKLSNKFIAEKDHPVMANILLCLAELTAVLKLKVLTSLPKLTTLLMRSSKQARTLGDGHSEIVLLASLAVLQRLLENLPQFLSSYIQEILQEISQIAVINSEEISARAFSSLQYRIKKIQVLLSNKIPLRVLMSPMHDSFTTLSESASTLSAIGPLMVILKEKFDTMQPSEIPNHVPELTSLFLQMLELRSNWNSEEDNTVAVSAAEEEIISALVTFVLKLQEPIFKPLFFKLFQWSKEAEQELAHHSRCITFFRVVSSFAEKLKGLFIVFVPIYIKQASFFLQTCHQNSTEQFFEPESSPQTLVLLEWVMKGLLQVFTNDRQRFVKQDTFDLLMQPLVDQLENMQGGEEAMLERGRTLVGPCLAQFARCMQDDVLWKQLHYQILLKTRSNNPKVRLVTIEAIHTLAEVLREDLLPLLPEAIPFIAELMEDEDAEVEKQTQHVSRELEKILGEPLDKYF